jgi:hypothetical protein
MGRGIIRSSGGACLRSRVRLASAIEGRNLLQGKVKMELNLKSEEITLILSALDNDTQGTWGDGRGERIESLMEKINSQLRKVEQWKQ